MSELAFLKELGWWGGFLFILLALSLRLFWGIQKDEGRGRWIAWLRHDRFSRRYRELLDAGLNRLDRWLSQDSLVGPTDPATNPKTEPARAWSSGLLDLCFAVALGYPVLAVLADWLATGNSATLGNFRIVDPVPDARLRLIALGLFCACLLASRKGWSAKSGRNAAFWWSSVLGLATLIGFIVARSWPFAVSVGAAVIVATALPFTVAFASPIAFAFFVLGTSAFALSYDLFLPLAFATALIPSLLTVVVVAYVDDAVEKRQSRNLFLFALTTTSLVSVAIGLSLLSEHPVPEAVVLPLFLGILPILNAWADFASVGLTRWRLRHGVQKQLVANAVIDVAAALVILILLAFSVVALMELIRPAGRPMFEVAGVLAALRDDPSNYWWLGFMLFSTLLPTLIHLCIGAFALFTLIPGWVRRPIAAGLRKGDSPEGRAAALALTFAAALAVWVPCFLLWHALTLGGGWLLDALLTACEWFHARLQTWFPISIEP